MSQPKSFECICKSCKGSDIGNTDVDHHIDYKQQPERKNDCLDHKRQFESDDGWFDPELHCVETGNGSWCRKMKEVERIIEEGYISTLEPIVDNTDIVALDVYLGRDKNIMQTVVSLATQLRNFSVLDWCHRREYKFTEQNIDEIITNASASGECGLVDWLLKRFNDVRTFSILFAKATRYGRFDIVKTLMKHRFAKKTELVSTSAAKRNNMAMLKFLKEQDWPLSEYVVKHAVKNNNLEMVKMAIDSGVKKTEDATFAAVTSGNKEMLLMLVLNGFPVNHEKCNGWLHE